MIIGVDGRAANADRRAGIGNYCFEVLRALADLKTGHTLRVYLDREPIAGFPRNGLEIRTLPACRVWTHRALRAELRRDPPDVFFAPGVQAPLMCATPMAATVLDLAPLRFPDHFTVRQRITAAIQFRYAARRADHLIAISEATRVDLRQILGVGEDRVTVAHLGVSQEFRPCADRERQRHVRETHGLGGPYLLYTGRIQPRKNLERLIEAFEIAAGRCPDLPHTLVIAGDKGWLYHGIYTRAQISPYKDRIRFLGFVEPKDLPVLMSGADALCLVSLWEGFGLPALEAMACGTAVVASNCSSLPEVVGDAGLLVDPLDTRAITGALERVLTDHALRRELEAKGIERARCFTWENSARAILGALERAAAKGKRK